MREIVINKTEEGTNIIALLENGKLIEKYDDKNSNKILEGNIYSGIVRNVLPGMQAAFVDIGLNKNVFIHIKDVIPKQSNETGNKEEKFNNYKIKDYLKPNMKILVQVKKNEEESKSAKVSKHISLTGRLCVLMIDVDFITISKKIEDEKERERLKLITKEVLLKTSKEEKYGIILRTGAEGKEKEEIENEINNLIKLWNRIKQTFESAKEENKPCLIFENYNIISKFLTSVLESEVDRIIVNSEETYDYIESYMKSINKKRIELKLNKEDDLMQFNQIGKQIDKMNDRKIWLKCGGFITIDKTEALTAIDINSGKFTGKKDYNKEITILKVNKEATIEIAKQIRLRNISGIIVIDYIDMEDDKDRKDIINLLENELKKDRSKTQVIGFTKLDLLEMTRKKI